jgi:hypothetical protein
MNTASKSSAFSLVRVTVTPEAERSRWTIRPANDAECHQPPDRCSGRDNVASSLRADEALSSILLWL